MKQIQLFTDGACSGNPGCGGWAAILRYKGHEKVLSGSEKSTTNNRMELTAVIQGLSALTETCAVTVVTDSQYVINGIEKGWASSWKKNGWRKADKKPALNADLWDVLLSLVGIHNVTFRWVHGHQGHPENERCDALAVEQYQKLQKMINKEG